MPEFMRMALFMPVISMIVDSATKDRLLDIVFRDKSNFTITTTLGNKHPDRYFVLSTSDRWNGNRFQLTDKQMQERDEHSAYMNSYIFKDSALNSMIAANEKMHLFQRAQASEPHRLETVSRNFTYINSFQQAKKGFFFSVTEPIYTSDGNFAFIDLMVYKKERRNSPLNDSYYSSVLLVNERVEGRGWTRAKKIEHLIL